MSEFSTEGEFQQTPEEKRRQKISKSVRELARRSEARELDPRNFGPEEVARLQSEGRPLTRAEVANRPVVITQQELEELGFLEIVLPNGEEITIDPEVTGYGPDDPLIIFPEELGDLEDDTIGKTEAEQKEADMAEIQEAMKYTVELPKSATFTDLVEQVRIRYGDEAAEEVEFEIEYQIKQFEDFDKNSPIIDLYVKEGHSPESVEAWLPIIFTD